MVNSQVTEQSSKFKKYYETIINDAELLDELKRLSTKEIKAKLSSIFPELTITGHFMRRLRKIIADLECKDVNNTPDSESSSTGTMNEDISISENHTESIAPAEIETVENDDDELVFGVTLDTDTTTETEPDTTNDSTDFALNESPVVLVSADKISTIDELNLENNKLIQENKNLNQNLELLNTKIDELNKRIRTLTISEEDKRNSIKGLLNTYSHSSQEPITVTINYNLIQAALSAFIKSNYIDAVQSALIFSDFPVLTIELALSEAVFLHGNDNTNNPKLLPK